MAGAGGVDRSTAKNAAAPTNQRATSPRATVEGCPTIFHPSWRCTVPKGMWSPTAVRPNAPPWGRQPSCESTGQAGMNAPWASGPVYPIPDRDDPSLPGPGRRVTSVSAGQRPFWWACQDLNLGPHPQVKIPARGGKLPGTYQGRRGPRPPPRSSQRPRGHGVLPIFIRQGWPQAMSHLSEIDS
jgi:hypothetical protein